jgi:hypothetical protein
MIFQSFDCIDHRHNIVVLSTTFLIVLDLDCHVLFVFSIGQTLYDDANLVTCLVLLLTACLTSSPGNINRKAVCNARLLSVTLLLHDDN